MMVCLAWYLGKYFRKWDIFIPRIDFSLILETLLSRSIDCIIKKQSTNDRGSPTDRKSRENILEVAECQDDTLLTCLQSSGRDENNYLGIIFSAGWMAGLPLLTLTSQYREVTTSLPTADSFLVIVHFADVIRDIPTDTSISRQTETHLFTRVIHVQTVNPPPLTQLERSQSSPLTEIVLRRP